MLNVFDGAPSKVNVNINSEFGEVCRVQDLKERRLYLYGEIQSVENQDNSYADVSMTSAIIEKIIEYNRQDISLPIEARKPIRLYINSPGGSVTEGFALVDIINLSKTPVHTINLGEWSSMAFLIGITGHKRFSLPNATFLMHDGSTFAFGSASKAQDKMDFEKRIEQEVVKPHVLKHSNMKSHEYDALSRVEYYLLPQNAIDHGFIDEIITDIDSIL